MILIYIKGTYHYSKHCRQIGNTDSYYRAAETWCTFNVEHLQTSNPYFNIHVHVFQHFITLLNIADTYSVFSY